MVALHLFIADLPFPRVTIDADTIVDVRARPDAARLASTGLVGAGWVGSGVDNVVHRFTSSTGGVVDILGPDGLRSLPITIPPATTLLAPGGTQLLRRASGVVITIRNGTRSIGGKLDPARRCETMEPTKRCWRLTAHQFIGLRGA